MTDVPTPPPEAQPENPTPAEPEPETSWADDAWEWVKSIGGMATDPVVAAVGHVITNRKAIIRRARIRFWGGFALMLLGIFLGANLHWFVPSAIAVGVGGYFMLVGWETAAIGVTAATAWGLAIMAFADLFPGEIAEIVKRWLERAQLQGPSVGAGNIRLIHNKMEKLGAVARAAQIPAVYILWMVLNLWLLPYWETFAILLLIALGGMIVVSLTLLARRDPGGFIDIWNRFTLYETIGAIACVLVKWSLPRFWDEIISGIQIQDAMIRFVRNSVEGSKDTLGAVAVVTLAVVAAFFVISFLAHMQFPFRRPPEGKLKENEEKLRAGEVVVQPIQDDPQRVRSFFTAFRGLLLLIATVTFLALGGAGKIKEWFRGDGRPAAATQQVSATPVVEVRYEYQPYVPPPREARQQGHRAPRLANRGEGEAADPVNAARMDALINRRR